MKRKLRLPLLSFTSLSLSASAFVAVSCAVQKDNNDYTRNIVSELTSSKDIFSPESFSSLIENTDINKDFAKRQIYREVVAAEHQQESAYLYDKSASYGSFLQIYEENLAGSLFRQETTLRPIAIDADGLKIVRPSVWRYKLEYADKVIVTTKDGVFEFDNDEAEVKPTAESEATFENKKFSVFNKIQYQLKSENQKSINSNYFFDKLKEATKLQFTVREGAKWVTNTGELTDFNIKPKDWYISWLRTIFLTKGVRSKSLSDAGLTSEQITLLDKNANATLDKGAIAFTEKRNYPNGYLYGLFNVNSDNFSDETKFLTDYNGKQAITFDVLKSDEKSYFDGLFEHLATSQDFIPAPSEYIASNSSSFKLYPLQNTEDAKNAAVAVETEVKKLSSDNKIVQAGVYWYGLSLKNTLVSGRYHFAGYNPDTQEEKFLRNENYFAVSQKSPKELIRRYQNNIDKEQLKNILFNEYKAGKISSLSTNNLNDKDKTEIIKDRNNYGAFYSRSLITNSTKYKTLPVLTPLSYQLSKNKVEDFNFNDNYSKLVYGLSRQELLNGTVSGVETLKKLYTGYGLSFRTMINAAINWEQVANFVSSGEHKSWISGYAPDGTINAKDASTTTKPTLLDNYEEISKLFAVDSDGTRIVLNEKLTEDKNKFVYPEQNAEKILDVQDDKLRIQSVAFLVLQQKVTQLLDKFYAENNLGENEKIQWTIPWRYTNWNPVTYESLFLNIIPELIRSLDTKNRLEPNYSYFSKREGLIQHLIEPTSGFQAAGWGYDLNSLGSGIDGQLYNGALQPLVILAGTDEAFGQHLAKSFPELAKLSKKMIEKVKDLPSVAGGVHADKFKELSLKDISALTQEYSHYKYENGNLIHSETEVENSGLFLEFTKFYVEYVSSISTDEAVALANEISNFIGPVIDRERTISKSLNLSFANPYINQPYFGTNMNWFSDITYANVDDSK
ncbi:Uncharacterised protein [Mycoplasmopsis maculosa]|uniref:Lipoprotein n=1 Tax=Mycoplasmopsis maculosa TaxID=114885 RepID=A0A449B5G8_9BACT|nr:hypothetical protein [Mycoplasmopsis maculosa]VEU75815.1 Uncharacterised protein [Mycoplasmopsis maculosa]